MPPAPGEEQIARKRMADFRENGSDNPDKKYKATRSDAAGGRNPDLESGDLGIDVDLMPKNKTTFSEWLRQDLESKLTMENSTQMAQHVSQGGDIHWLGFADWARDHVHELQGLISMFIDDESNWIFGFFPLRQTNATTFKQTFIEIESNIPEMGTRKVPFRNIHAKMSSRESHSVYSGTATQFDYNDLKTPDGIEHWDLQIAAIGTHVWTFIAHQALFKFQSDPSKYSRMEQLYPNASVPRTPKDLFLYEQTKFGIFNKEPQAIHQIIADVNRIMAPTGNRVDRIVTSRDDLWHFKANDRTEIDYSATGPVAITNRGHELSSTVDGVRIFPVPIQHGKLHGTPNERALQSVVTKGTFGAFVDNSLTMPASEYRSFHRTIKYGSWSTNEMDSYDFMTFLRHCLQFNKDDGEINRDALEGLIAARMETYKQMQTEITDETMEKLDTLIRYDKEKQRHYIINCFGELPECFAKGVHLKKVGQTMEHAIFSELSNDQMRAFDKGMVLAKELQNRTHGADLGIDAKWLKIRGEFGGPDLGFLLTDADGFKMTNLTLYGLGNINGFLEINKVARLRPDAFKKEHVKIITDFVSVYAYIVSKMYEISPNHVIFAPEMVPLEHARGLPLSTSVQRMTSAWYSVFSNYTSSQHAGVHARDEQWDNEYETLFEGTYFSALQHGDSMMATSGDIFDELVRRGLISKAKRNPGGQRERKFRSSQRDVDASAHPFIQYITNRDQLTQGVTGSKLTDFEARWAESHLFQNSLAVAYRFFLCQTINVDVLQSYYRNNIRIPFGGVNLRPCESQIMTSQVHVAAGEIGKTAFSGLDSTIGFDQFSQHFSVQLFWSCAPLITAPDKFYITPFTRGSQMLGGKGNLYVNDLVDICSNSVDAQAIVDNVMQSNGELLGSRSNIAVLGGYNNAVERRDVYHMDVRGNFRPEDFQGRMTDSPEHFLRNNRVLMYDGQPLTNYIFHGFGNCNPTYGDMPSFDQICTIMRRNFHVHQPTTMVYDRGRLVELQSYHPWGREQEGLADVQQSLCPVDRDG